MPSILPGYSYDIFISYRHKDNKYDGWVTEFVANLRKELDATLKDDVSIYFDFNPDDGLLESHNVDKSLEGKLNSLIFIPILSQTYCDPRSFAWQHEFCAFNTWAKADTFGRDITLRNGNVASRILPVRVRELDPDDKKMIEDELGSVLRPIDFIYKEQGVNRPLKPEDSEDKNLNHTKYRNQINKTANAIKEIVTALKWKQSGATAPPPALIENDPEPAPFASIPTPEPRQNREQRKKIGPVRTAIRWILIVGGVLYFVFGWNKNWKSDDEGEEQEISEKSIAVLPFTDMSPSKDQEYFSDGIAEEILNSLAHIKGLKVAGRTSSFQYKGKEGDLKEIGDRLNVSTVLEGSVRKAGNRVRITAQLINVKNGYHIWSEVYDRDMTDIFAIQDEVASKIAGVLLKELAAAADTPQSEQTESVKAYEYYLEGKYINLHQFVSKGKQEDFLRAEDLFKKALSLDSNYALAHAGLADLYNTYYNRVKRDPHYMDLQKHEIEVAMRLNPNLDYVHNALGQIQLTNLEYENAYHSFVRACELKPNEANNLNALSGLFLRLGLLDESIKLTDRAIMIEPLEANNYLARGSALFSLGKFDEATKDLKEALRQHPENYAAIIQIAFLYMIKGDMPESRKYIDSANHILPQYKGMTGVDAAYEAKLGHKEAALKLKHDFRTYLILGMKEEGITEMLKAMDATPPPINVYLSVTKSAQLKLIGDDPRIKAFIAKQKEGYLRNKENFKMPILL